MVLTLSTMPTLPNPQHDQFARLLADGMAMGKAYEQVYPGTNERSARAQACLLTERPEVLKRIEELLEATEEDAIWSLAERLDYLRAVATTSYAEITAESPICRGVRCTAHGIEFRMPNKLAAVALYGKLAGDADRNGGPERDLLGELMGAIRSDTWEKLAARPKKGKVLADWRQERFAQLVGSGERAAYAYEKIYEGPRSAAVLAGHRLAHQPDVAERIAGIRQAGAARAGWTRQMRMRYLRDLAEIPVGQIDEASCYCQGVRRTRYGDEIITPDKVKAVAMYTALATVQTKRKSETIEEIAASMRTQGNPAVADGTERSLIKFITDTVG